MAIEKHEIKGHNTEASFFLQVENKSEQTERANEFKQCFSNLVPRNFLDLWQYQINCCSFFKKIYLIMCLMWVCACECMCLREPEEGVWFPGPELQEVVRGSPEGSHTKPKSSAKALRVLNHCSISPVPKALFFHIKKVCLSFVFCFICVHYNFLETVWWAAPTDWPWKCVLGYICHVLSQVLKIFIKS